MCVSCSSINFSIIFVLFCSLDGGHCVVFEVSVKCEDDPYLCVFWRLGKMSIFWKGLELGRERLCPWLTSIQMKYLVFFTWILLSDFFPIGERWNFLIADIAAWWNYQSMKSWWPKLRPSICPVKENFQKPWELAYSSQQLKLKSTVGKEFRKCSTSLPCPPLVIFDENAYVLGSYEFYSAFS